MSDSSGGSGPDRAPTTLAPCPSCGGVNRVETARALAESAVCGRCQAALPFHRLVCEASGAGVQKVVRQADGPVVVDLWATWCPPCRMYGPIFEEVSTELAGEAVFLKVNTEENQEFSTRLGVTSIPTTLVYVGGQIVARQPGALRKPDLIALIRRHS